MLWTILTAVFGALAIVSGLIGSVVGLRDTTDANQRIEELKQQNLVLQGDLDRQRFAQQQLEKKVLPRRLDAEQTAYIKSSSGLHGAIDLWFLPDAEPVLFAGDIYSALTAAGATVTLRPLPSDTRVSGASAYVVPTDAFGRRVADILRDAGVTNGEVGVQPQSPAQPATSSNITIGVSDAAFQGDDGYPRSTRLRVDPSKPH